MFVKKDDVHKPIVALNSDGVKRRKSGNLSHSDIVPAKNASLKNNLN